MSAAAAAMLVRGMTRLVGATTVGAAAAAAAMPSPAFCHVKPQDQLPILAQTEDCSAALPSKPLLVYDAEHCGVEESIDRPHNHLVFAPLPSQQEVEDATKELRAALHLSIPATQGSSDSVPGRISCDKGAEMTVTVRGKQDVLDTSSVLSSHLGTLAAGSSSVYEAFQLLQTNPQVQDAVKSLASDAAVWKAVSSNEKVKELMQSLRDRNGNVSRAFGLEDLNDQAKDESEEMNFCQKLTSSVYDFLAKKLLQLMGKIVDIVSSVFGSVEKTFSSKEDVKPMDMTLASCMMLAVAVLLVVVIKRGLPL